MTRSFCTWIEHPTLGTPRRNLISRCTWSKWWLRQNERTEYAEKLITPSEGQDQIEAQMGTYRIWRSHIDCWSVLYYYHWHQAFSMWQNEVSLGKHFEISQSNSVIWWNGPVFHCGQCQGCFRDLQGTWKKGIHILSKKKKCTRKTYVPRWEELAFENRFVGVSVNSTLIGWSWTSAQVLQKF